MKMSQLCSTCSSNIINNNICNRTDPSFCPNCNRVICPECSQIVSEDGLPLRDCSQCVYIHYNSNDMMFDLSKLSMKS